MFAIRRVDDLIFESNIILRIKRILAVESDSGSIELKFTDAPSDANDYLFHRVTEAEFAETPDRFREHAIHGGFESAR